MQFQITDPVALGPLADPKLSEFADTMTEALTMALKGALADLEHADLSSFLADPNNWVNIQLHVDGESYAATRTIGGVADGSAMDASI